MREPGVSSLRRMVWAHGPSRGSSWLRAAEHVTFGISPLIVTGWVLTFVWAHNFNGPDFRLQYWLAAHHVLGGQSPYPALTVSPGKFAFPYPAPTAFLFVPFALFGSGMASMLFTGICIALPLLTLRVLGVRDWRLYGMVLLLQPVVAGWENANLSIPLTFGLAVVWRYRNVPVVAGALAALLMSVKLFMWPIVIWLLATRRWAAATVAIAGAVAINAVAWGVIGFNEIHLFIRVSEFVTRQYERTGYGLIALLMHLGAPPTVASVVAVTAACALAVGCVVVGRAGRDQTALLLAVSLMLVASPLVWSHYFTVMIVPLALARPRLGPLWALQLPLWLGSVGSPTATECALGISVIVVTTVLLARDDRPERALRAPGASAVQPVLQPRP